jgi:type IV secretory pathway VirB4 component
MLKLKSIFQNYEETGALNAQLNLYGFIGDQIFLTKTGDLGAILEVRGVDYECLDGASIDALTKRLESALKLFGEDYRVYQYLFKRNNPGIPHQLYGNAVVDTAIQNRIAYLQSKSERLFSLSIYYVVLFEGARHARTLMSVLLEIPERPRQALGELQAWFSTQKQVVFLDRELVKAQSALLEKARSFLLQVADFLSVRLLDKQEAFRVLTQILNFAPHKLEHAHLKHDTFLDYYVAASHLECHRGHLRVDEYYVKVLTLKEPSAQSFPLIFQRLLEVQANFYVVTEWKKEDSGKMRRVIQAKRRHFHNTKRSFISQVNLNDDAPQDAMLDDSKESQVRELGESIKEIELHGNYFGRFSLTVVIYDLDLHAVDRASAEFYKVFSVHDAQLYEERYNLLNSFLAAVPGNHAWNLRGLYLLNANYADYSFLFTLNSGEPRNAHLRREYLAVLETCHNTPYFLNLHYHDVAHTLVLGRTGAGKFFSLSRQPKCIPIIATQSVSSLKSTLPGETWRTLLQTFRTKIFLALSDDFSAKIASELCGREDRLKTSYNLSESGHDASISLLTGQAISHRANIGASKSYYPHSDLRFDTKTFTELKNAQAIVLAYDGLNPMPPTFCYLKPYYNDPNKSYFQQLAEGQL